MFYRASYKLQLLSTQFQVIVCSGATESEMELDIVSLSSLFFYVHRLDWFKDKV